MFQRGFQLPQLPLGTATVEVNGVEYRVRTITVDQQGGVLMVCRHPCRQHSVEPREDSGLFGRRNW